MADMTRSKKKDNPDKGPSEKDQDAIRAGQRYQAQLLGQYLNTQQQTVPQDSRLLGENLRQLSDVALQTDEADRLAQLRFLQQHGQAINFAGRNADPRTNRLLNQIELTNNQTGAPTALDNRLNQEALGAGPSQLSQMLDAQAQEQLRLGGSLSAEETRQADQAARGAWADRGLQFSNPAMISEVLNRQSASNARLAGRQQFGLGVNQQLLGEQQNNRGFQLGVAGYQEGKRQDTAGTALGLASLRSSTSPVAQLLSRGTNTGMLLGGATSALGSGTAGATNLTGLQDAYTGFLMNRSASKDIANINAKAGLQSSQMQADAAESAGDSQLLGAGIGAAGAIVGAALLLCHVAREVYGETDPRWEQFREWLLAFGSARRQRRYRLNGPTIAKWIAPRPAYKARVKRWMDRCIAQVADGMRFAA